MISTDEWEQRLTELLPLYGHRNWIVIADAAYPLQASAGITTISTEVDHITIVERTLALIEASSHIRAKVHIDKELDWLTEEDANGITQLRQRLFKLMDRSKMQIMPHEEIIESLDDTARLFSVLIIKTRMNLPYTSVFLQLDCGYWNEDAEDRLRSAMMAGVGEQQPRTKKNK